MFLFPMNLEGAGGGGGSEGADATAAPAAATAPAANPGPQVPEWKPVLDQSMQGVIRRIERENAGVRERIDAHKAETAKLIQETFTNWFGEPEKTPAQAKAEAEKAKAEEIQALIESAFSARDEKAKVQSFAHEMRTAHQDFSQRRVETLRVLNENKAFAALPPDAQSQVKAAAIMFDLFGSGQIAFEVLKPQFRQFQSLMSKFTFPGFLEVLANFSSAAKADPGTSTTVPSQEIPTKKINARPPQTPAINDRASDAKREGRRPTASEVWSRK